MSLEKGTGNVKLSAAGEAGLNLQPNFQEGGGGPWQDLNF